MKSESHRPVAIEDLLRLKRAERPPVEFWAEFDRQLRAKQLSALVAKRPWWQSLSCRFSFRTRYRLCMGAGATLAVAFLGIRSYHGSSAPAAELPNGPVIASAVTGANSISASEMTQPMDITPAPAVLVGTSSVSASFTDGTTAGGLVSATDISRLIALGGRPVFEPGAVAELVSADSPPRSFGSAQFANMVTTRPVLGSSQGFESRGLGPRAAVEPLQQMTPPSDTRRSRLLTAMVASASTEGSARAAERAANRFAEERGYDQSHRFEARASWVNMKF